MSDVPLTAAELISFYKKQFGDDGDFGIFVGRMILDMSQRVARLEARVRELETSKKR